MSWKNVLIFKLTRITSEIYWYHCSAALDKDIKSNTSLFYKYWLSLRKTLSYLLSVCNVKKFKSLVFTVELLQTSYTNIFLWHNYAISSLCKLLTYTAQLVSCKRENITKRIAKRAFTATLCDCLKKSYLPAKTISRVKKSDFITKDLR